ncbi:hypothetical protein BCY88_22015 [Paraburkholderia fungorum]|uniref:Uncharacterized protein n=1 Tax=Paraburkholderia fungorum TaxID=134537 RepID=A0A3R7LBU0_9BURK|nr:hypothetical protein BCY88_22015 [Paraburkholderia fungorum]
MPLLPPGGFPFHWRAPLGLPHIDGDRITGGKAFLESFIEAIFCGFSGLGCFLGMRYLMFLRGHNVLR